ncbi:hypothetical protein [Neptuniibacter sp. CAU 1671]|uniref:hypothetical protein n=1 Tax=Neptuniibacter sp. CAU 1671 TaxID=3032593 RepID=UPI0023DA2389|nr:hypothetical protein [Neptuniibacter sp. CAU 1671]MDF2180954.1 hypothetical protein [Neptuniibacter sp. CAU 1671]
MNRTLIFEISIIFLLVVLGLALLAHSLPGWGLLAVSALLTVSSVSLRLINAGQSSMQVSNG